MAETAGLALGTISLAIQVCQGIITYADAIRGKTNALARLDLKAKALSQILESLGQILQRMKPITTSAQSTTTVSPIMAITTSIRSCAADLKELENFLDKYAAGCKVSSPNFKATCKKVYKSLKFGFREKEVKEMEQRLTTVTSLLEASTGTLNTDLLLDITEQSRSLHTSNNDVASTLNNQAQAIRAVQADSSRHLDKLGKLQHTLEHLEGSLVDLVQAKSSHTDEHISGSVANITELITLRSRDMEDLAVANQTMVLNELAAMKDAVEALTHGLEGSSSSEQNMVSLGRLISQPALLRDTMTAHAHVYQAREKHTTPLLVDEFPNLVPCDCRGYRSLSSSGFSIGTGQFSLLRQDTFRHNPQCRFYASAKVNKITKITAQAKFRAFNLLIRRALKITINLPWGAGGLGIGAQLSARLIVDDRRSPSFKIIRWIVNVLRSETTPPGVQAMEFKEGLVGIALQKLHEIFKCGKASPRDINTFDETLLNFFIKTLTYFTGREDEVEIMRLVSWQLIHTFHNSPAQGDHFNIIPLAEALDYPNKSLIETLVPRPDDALNEKLGLNGADTQTLVMFPSATAAICTVYCVDPLSEAILCGQPEQVQKLIKEHPVLLQETPSFDHHTHLHLAASAGRCFMELFVGLTEAARAGDNFCTTYLSRALRFDHPRDGTLADYLLRTCHTKDGEFQQGPGQCQNSLALAKLMKLECDMSPSALCHKTIYPWDRLHSCATCAKVYFSELAGRRQILKKIGLEHLSPDQVTAFELNGEGLLDRHTDAVVDALEELSVPIPRHISTASGYLPYSSVWGIYTLNLQHADVLLDVGFQDVTPLTEEGTPIEQLIQAASWHVRAFKGENAAEEVYSMIIWTLEHSPDEIEILERRWQYRHECGRNGCMLCRSTEDLSQSPTIGHVLAGVLGESLIHNYIQHGDGGWDNWYLHDHWELLTAKVLRMSILDRSSCLCLEMGREPFDFLWREVVGSIDDDSPTNLVSKFCMLAQFCGHDLRSGHLKAAVRYLTFEVLSLEHTCGRNMCEDCLDEAAELANDQQRTQLFHNIQQWFEETIDEKLRSRYGSEASADSEVQNSVVTDEGEGDRPRSAQAVDDDESSSISASSEQTDRSESDSTDMPITEEMWTDLLFDWADRMEQELENMFLQSVKENHMQAGEDIGVAWCKPPSADESEESASPPYGSKEYWLLALEKIWPERKA